MAKKKDISKEILELKKGLEEDTLVIGANDILRGLKGDLLSKIYLASNCPAGMKEDISRYASMAKVPVTMLEIDNEEVGMLCKKHFYISVLGIKKK